MKFLFTNSFYPPYHVGGACTHSKYLAEALVKDGHEVHVMASLDAYHFKRGFEHKKETHQGVKVHWLKSPLGRAEPVLNYTFGTQSHTYSYFKQLIAKENFDVVHHHNISLLGYTILRKIGNYRNIYTAHDYWLICPKYDFFRFEKVCSGPGFAKCLSCCTLHKKPFPVHRYLAEFKRSVQDIDLVIAPSKYMQKKLQEHGIKNKVVQLYNFVPAPPQIKPIKLDSYFVFVGQLESHKGILELASVFSSIPKNLVILGKGSLQKQIEAIIRQSPNISYVGFKSRDETLSYMAHAQALILPSTGLENNPMTILEALSVGTPSIGSANGGIPELVQIYDKKLIFKDMGMLKKIILAYDKKKYPAVQDVYKNQFSQESYVQNYYKYLR